MILLTTKKQIDIMTANLIEHIITNLLMTCFISLSFMAFMHNFNKKSYFMSGVYLSATVAFCTLLIIFIINLKP